MVKTTGYRRQCHLPIPYTNANIIIRHRYNDHIKCTDNEINYLMTQNCVKLTWFSNNLNLLTVLALTASTGVQNT